MLCWGPFLAPRAEALSAIATPGRLPVRRCRTGAAPSGFGAWLATEKLRVNPSLGRLPGERRRTPVTLAELRGVGCHSGGVQCHHQTGAARAKASRQNSERGEEKERPSVNQITLAAVENHPRGRGSCSATVPSRVLLTSGC